MKSDKLQWSEWLPLTEENEKPSRVDHNKDKNKQGIVYQIAAFSGKSLLSLPEIAEPKDGQGIVYIGMQTNAHRLKDFRKVIKGESKDKSTAASTWIRDYAKKYGSEFNFRYAKVDSIEARYAEATLILEYYKKFGRKPLLNKQI